MSRITLSNLAFFSLVILLPFNHLYSYLSYVNVLPLFRGINLFPLCFVSIMFLCLFKQKKQSLMWKGLIGFFIVIVSAFSVILLSPNAIDSLGRDSFLFNIKILVYYGIYFFVGLNIEKISMHKKTIFLLWFFMFLNLVLHFDITRMRISFAGFEKDKIGIYLFLGDSFALWSIALFSTAVQKPCINSIFIICSILGLFAFNSRTSLYAFILVIPLILLITKKTLRYFAFVGVILFLIVAFSGFLSIEKLQKTNKRMLAVFNLENDSSFIAREHLEERGTKGLKKNLFVGDYNGQLEYGSLGAYIHNYLSLWRQFGFPCFLAFCTLLFIFLSRGWKIFIQAHQKREKSPVSADAFFFLVGGSFCFIEILAARSYGSPYIWLFLGMAIKDFIPFEKERQSYHITSSL